MAKRRSLEQWQMLLKQQRHSGLSVAQFCHQHQIGESNFYLKRRKFKDSRHSLAAFVAARPDIPQPALSIALQYGQCQLQLNTPHQESVAG